MAINYQKLAVKQLLSGNEELLHKITAHSFTQKVPSTLYKGVSSYYDKYSTMPTTDVMLAFIAQNFSAENASIYTGYIEGLANIDDDGLVIDVLIQELNHGKRIKDIDSNIEALVEASENKDIEQIASIIEVLYNTTDLTIEVPEVLESIDPLDNNIASLDSCFATFRENNTKIEGLTIITGQSGGGKSLLALEQAIYSHTVEDQDVLFISLELPKKAIWSRLMSSLTMIPYSKLYYEYDQLTKEELSTIETAKKIMEDKPNKFRIIDTPMTPEEIKKLIRQQHKLYKIGLVVIDYLSIVSAPSGLETWKWLEGFVKDLHQLTLELGIVIVSPAQIHQSEVDIQGTQVQIRTRGSAELLNSASLLLHIHDPTEEDSEDKTLRVVYTVKARNAKKIGIFAQTQFQFQKFIDMKVKVE